MELAGWGFTRGWSRCVGQHERWQNGRETQRGECKVSSAREEAVFLRGQVLAPTPPTRYGPQSSWVRPERTIQRDTVVLFHGF